MNILHIFRQEPDDIVRSIIPPVQPPDKATEIRLDDDSTDYAHLLELILESDKVYTWF
jgi:hypothetical protein